jgi:preprotein translocase subunit YajC
VKFLNLILILSVQFMGGLSLAQEAGAAGKPSIFEQLMPFVFIFIIFYFLLIRPQQRRAKEHQGFLEKLKKGDNVLTSGGVFGTIEGLTDKFVTLEVANGVRIRILKTQIASPMEEGPK